MDSRGIAQLILQVLELSQDHLTCCEKSFQTDRPSYHNEEHCFSTAVTFYELAQTAELDQHALRHGFLAALYHDANHQRAPHDSANIEAAVAWYGTHAVKDQAIEPETVQELIRATHNGRRKFYSKTEELLHDADLLQTVKGNVWENVIWQKKLAEELASSITLETSLAFVQRGLVGGEAKALLHQVVRRGKQLLPGSRL